jgi:hypothetical protein
MTDGVTANLEWRLHLQTFDLTIGGEVTITKRKLHWKKKARPPLALPLLFAE